MYCENDLYRTTDKRTDHPMSGTNQNAIYANVNKTGTSGRASNSSAASSGILTGGGAINFPNSNRPSPDPSYFDKAKAAQNERGYRKDPR